MKIFTCTSVVGVIAAALGWDAYPPITLPDYDLRISTERRRARRNVQEVDPDFVVLVQPCTPWSQLQNLHQRSPEQCWWLQQKQEEDRGLLMVVQKVVQWQGDRHRAVVAESPLQALPWKDAPMIGSPNMSSALCDTCCHGKMRPDTADHVHKHTMAKGTERRRYAWP